MSKKMAAGGEDAPKKISMYTAKLSEEQMGQVRAYCDSRMWQPFDVDYARFAFKGPKIRRAAGSGYGSG
jgi:ribonuclease HIII